MNDGPAGFASVAVPIPLRRNFTYEVPEALRGAIEPGLRVRVPFGPRSVVGTVVEWPVGPPEPGVEVKRIQVALPDEPPLPRPVLELTRFLADYYLCSWGEAIEAARAPGRLTQLRGPKCARRLPATDLAALPSRAAGQRRLIEALPEDGSWMPVAALPGAGKNGVIAALIERGWIEVQVLPVHGTTALPPCGPGDPPPVPTVGQAAVLEQILPALSSGGFRPFLLFGATGSGKTEVYLRAAAATLAAGRGVIYLVPEIGLTPLLLSKITRRFPGQVALLHSGLSPRERREAWTRLRDGQCGLALGTRSALFAPLPDPGLIVVDEEHDGSYKQAESPRYNARDLAVVRARSAGAVLLLGSATPSMESFHHATCGRYELLRLGGRIEARPLPTVRVVDMRAEFKRSATVSPLSLELSRELVACMERGDQALILRNRRGWAAAIVCPRCGRRLTCDGCSVALTWHRAHKRLRCHYCGSERRRPEACPTCGVAELKELGEGTERIEDLVRAVVPGARIERMDRDSMRRRGAQGALLQRFERGEIDVLVGTQMIAKGHDFPRVTLVGVLSADQVLGLPDFRAAERVFQLLTQVAGRAGRGTRPGTVVVQVFDPDHPVVRQAAQQDYEAFFAGELRYRRALRYPPFSALVQLIVSDPEEHRARHWAETVGEALRAEGQGRIVLSGPGPAPLERLKGRFRQQILVRSAGRRRLIEVVDRALATVAAHVPRRGLTVDVDPYSLL